MPHNIKKYIVAFLVLALSVWPVLSWGAVVINEVQIGGVTSTDEFVELYNNGDVSVSLNGWRLSKKTASGTESNLVSSFTDFVLEAGATLVVGHNDFTGLKQLVYSAQNSIAANNSVVLYSDGGITVVDVLGMGNASMFEAATAVVPALSKSVARVLGADTNNNAQDFVEGEPSVGSIPGIAIVDDVEEVVPDDEVVEENETENSEDDNVVTPVVSSGGGGATTYYYGNVLINEFVSDPVAGQNEWVELINMTGNNIDLNNWQLTDGAGTVTNLSGILMSGALFVVDKPNGALNNSGDEISLWAPGKILIAKVAYGNWDDGRPSDNAPVATDPHSVARFDDLYDITTLPTKGQPNVKNQNTSNISSTNSSVENKTITTLVISELFADPVGSDDLEFIELYNDSNVAVDISGWRLVNGKGQEYVLPAGTNIEAKKYKTFLRTETGLVLNNASTETVSLYKPNVARAVDVVSYSGPAKANKSWSRVNGEWFWTVVTAGAVNEYVALNKPPVLVARVPEKLAVSEVGLFNAEDSYDAEKDMFSLRWVFDTGDEVWGDSASYVYNTAGVREVKLQAWHKQVLLAEKNFKITVGQATGVVKTVALPKTNVDYGKMMVRLQRLMPRPATGEVEWIELYNSGDVPVELHGWQVADAERSYELLAQKVSAKGTVRLPKTMTKLALNNDGDDVSLLDPNNKIIDSVSYEDAPVGQSLDFRDAQGWMWSGANDVTVSMARVLGETTDQVDPSNTLQGEIDVVGVVTFSSQDSDNEFVYVRLNDGRGVRVDLPDGLGWQVARGDMVRVVGKVRQVGGEPRVKLEGVENITFVNGGNEVAPKIMDDVVKDNEIGKLVQLTGAIDKGTSAGFNLLQLDGTVLRVVMPKNVPNKRPFPLGTEVQVTGVVSKTTAGLRLLVRDVNDLEATMNDDSPAKMPAPTRATADWWTSKYLVIIVGVVLALLIIIYMWRRQTSETMSSNLNEEEIDF